MVIWCLSALSAQIRHIVSWQEDNPREEGLCETKNDVVGLVTEDGGSYCWI